MSGWYSIIFKLNSFYSQCSTGLLSAVFDITNEVDSCCNMVENGNPEQEQGLQEATDNIKETAPDTDETGGFFNG